jgi:prolyl-tRNA synthetase
VGVSRIVAAAIEQNHDERGIRWPAPLAPFDLALLPMNARKSPRVAEAADRLYEELRAAGVEVLYDDRTLRPGVMFNDVELIGIPHRLVVGERGLDEGMLEYRARDAEDNEAIPLDEAVAAVLERIKRRNQS